MTVVLIASPSCLNSVAFRGGELSIYESEKLGLPTCAPDEDRTLNLRIIRDVRLKCCAADTILDPRASLEVRSSDDSDWPVHSYRLHAILLGLRLSAFRLKRQSTRKLANIV